VRRLRRGHRAALVAALLPVLLGPSACAGGSSDRDDDRALARSALLTVSDLPGEWRVEPPGTDDGDPLTSDDPACEALSSLDTDPALASSARVDLTSADQAQYVFQEVTVGGPDAVAAAADKLEDPSSEECLEAIFAEAFADSTGDGGDASALDLTAAPLAAGDQAVSYTGRITLDEEDVSVPVQVAFDAIRVDRALSLLMVVSLGAGPVDHALLARRAAQRMAGLEL
jgi:hypothetical protein